MKTQKRYFYPAIFTYEDGYDIAVTFPDLGVATCGIDDKNALLNARDLLGGVLCGLEEDGEEIPNPTPMSLIKAEENERVVLVEVYLPTFKMANQTKAVNRTVTLPAWLNALALEYEVNFSQLLQEAIKKHLDEVMPKF